ncbi:hypothetical protein APU90_05280 [Rathayibacter toxicus]|nr:hypothetical protein APU90_05280 [Rathayibacter toxicus]PPG19327.1 hypothetical protein C5D15_10695 [Rathayibacter toxicus]PPH61848.1 hypothetical protein C5D13_10745 [Rathayibacter toxicus]PPH65834.1 hypothetical protein C5D01_10760 [Rathayibacter toxicus]PPH80295.1 hypothetical protein C5D20_10755 [Rathayibacter toxicus]
MIIHVGRRVGAPVETPVGFHPPTSGYLKAGFEKIDARFHPLKQGYTAIKIIADYRFFTDGQAVNIVSKIF